MLSQSDTDLMEIKDVGRLFDDGDILLCLQTGKRQVLYWKPTDIFKAVINLEKNGGPIQIVVRSRETYVT